MVLCDATAFCNQQGMGLPTIRELTNAPGVRNGNGTRVPRGPLQGEWGDISHYTNQVLNNPPNMAQENDAETSYEVNLITGYIYDVAPDVKGNAVCISHL